MQFSASAPIPAPPTRQRVAIHTVGCRLNHAESQILAEKLAGAGYRLTPFDGPAEVGVIHTCAVTVEAEAKCRQAIRSFLRRNPNAFVAVLGCYSQTGAAALAALPGVDLILGNQEKLNLIDYLGQSKSPTPIIVREIIDPSDFSISYAGERPTNLRTNLKIQDGCDFLCSFCLVPFARGRARSRDFHNTLEEARQSIARGVKELILTGVNLGLYAPAGHDLVALLDSLATLPGLCRLRLGSIEPTTVPEPLLDRMADPAHPLMPYLHLPLQSGSNAVLSRMRRRYSVEEYVAFARRAVARVPGLCLGTDLLTGFPGETEDDFQATCRTFRELPFAYGHVFTFSEREGTLAARLGDPVPPPERNRRGAWLRRLSARQRHDFHSTRLGQTVEVLFENSRTHRWPGLTPDYIRVYAESPESLANRRALVRLDRVAADFMEGVVLQIIDPPGEIPELRG